MVKIRLQRRGRRKKPFYHIVIADSRSPRDGRFIEKVGTYNPMTKPATIDLDADQAFDWLLKGAQPTDTVRAILRVKGVMYRKHLHRGVLKGALTEEQAATMLAEWVGKKESKFADRFAETAKEKEALRRKVAGVAPEIKAPEPEYVAPPELTPTIESAAEAAAPVVEEAPAPAPVEEAPAPVVEEAPEPAAVVEEASAPVAEEAPAPAPVEEAAPAKEEAPAAKPEKLTKIEGIGPKIAEVLNNNGVLTFAQLAEQEPAAIKTMLTEAEGNFGAHVPDTWPTQAKLAADGKWDELKELQDKLDGGKPA